jgi:hypothetical protein
MTEAKISTYADSQDGVDLPPARTRLLFAAWIHHGPGFPEKVEYRVGPSKCGQFDVLWLKSDWDDENPLTAAAWIPRRHMRGKPLHLHLLQSLFRAQKTRESANGPNFNEIASATTGLLTSKEVWDLARWVFRNDRS